MRSISRLCVFMTLSVGWGCGLTVVGDASTDGGAAQAAEGGASGGTPDAPAPEAGPRPDTSAIDSGDSGGGRLPIHAQQALSLSASAPQYVNVGTIPIPADFTVEAWVKPNKAGLEMGIVSEDRGLLGDLDNQFRLALTSTGLAYFAMTDKDGKAWGLAQDVQLGPFALTGSTPVSVGTWTHLAVAKSGTSFTLFVNGLIAAAVSSNNNGTFERSAGGTFAFRVGARMGNGGAGNGFDGLIDDVRLFAVGRSQGDIEGDMHTELVAADPAFSHLTAYWRFDDGAGTIAHDALNAWNGTLVNGASWVDSTAF